MTPVPTPTEKITHPKLPQIADAANLSPSKCYEGPLLGRSPFLIGADSIVKSSSNVPVSNIPSFKISGAVRTPPQLPKITHPKLPQIADAANLSPSKCYEEPLLGRSPFLIGDDSSAKIQLTNAAVIPTASQCDATKECVPLTASHASRLADFQQHGPLYPNLVSASDASGGVVHKLTFLPCGKVRS
ncbi:hypothetical protein CDAR_78141 [Caerostris darwini]|uniref:Uncharacterized protein n=1 Tax=Caerostris darwini TaxID=1538125 RepID=A0AAV4SFG5_9ARAC|nr:hypothetical protein CDAR_78141 [Caerostris darwini]